MAANNKPIFTIVPNSIPVFLDYANTASDGSGTLTTLVTAGVDGTRVDQVVFRNAQQTVAASTAQLGKIFLTDNGSPENSILVGEIALAAATRSATVIGSNSTFTFSPPLIMKAGQKLKVCVSIGNSSNNLFSCVAYSGDY